MKYPCHSNANDLYAWWNRKRVGTRERERTCVWKARLRTKWWYAWDELYLFWVCVCVAVIDCQICIMFREMKSETDSDNWSNKSIDNVIKRSIFEWYISYKFIYKYLIIDVYFLHFFLFVVFLNDVDDGSHTHTHTHTRRYRYIKRERERKTW